MKTFIRITAVFLLLLAGVVTMASEPDEDSMEALLKRLSSIKYDSSVLGYKNYTPATIAIPIDRERLKLYRNPPYRITNENYRAYFEYPLVSKRLNDALFEIPMINMLSPSVLNSPNKKVAIAKKQKYFELYNCGRVALSDSFTSILLWGTYIYEGRPQNRSSLFLLNIKYNKLLSILRVAYLYHGEYARVGYLEDHKDFLRFTNQTITEGQIVMMYVCPFRHPVGINPFSNTYADFRLDDNGQVVILPDQGEIRDKISPTQIKVQRLLEEILLQEYLCNIISEEQLLIQLRYMLEKKEVESLILRGVKRDRDYMLEYIDVRLQSIRHTPYYQGDKLHKSVKP